VTQQTKPTRGRPKVSTAKAKAKWISARFSPEEAKEIEAAIKASGKTKSKWVREALLNRFEFFLAAKRDRD
jgi:predicted DNA-binding protein